MAKYIKNIKVNGVTNLVSTCNNKNIKDITIKGTTYTRNSAKLDPIEFTSSSTMSMNTQASDTSIWASNSSSKYVDGMYGNFSSTGSSATVYLYSNSTGSSSNIKAEVPFVYPSGQVGLKVNCKGPDAWFNGYASVTVKSTPDSSDKINLTSTTETLQFPFKSHHKISKGFGCLIWGNADSRFITPNGDSSNPGDVNTPWGQLFNQCSNEFGSGNVINMVDSTVISPAGASSYFRSQGYEEGVIIYLANSFETNLGGYANEIKDAINDGFSVIIVGGAWGDIYYLLLSGVISLPSGDNQFLIFIEPTPSSQFVYQAIYNIVPDVLKIIRDEGWCLVSNYALGMTYLRSQDSFFNNRVVQANFNYGENGGEPTSNKSWWDIISEAQNFQSGIVFDLTYPMYMIYDKENNFYNEIIAQESSIADPDKCLFVSNIGASTEYNIAEKLPAASYLLMDQSAAEYVASVARGIKGYIDGEDFGSILDSVLVRIPSEPGLGNNVIFGVIPPVVMGEGVFAQSVDFDWHNVTFPSDFSLDNIE